MHWLEQQEKRVDPPGTGTLDQGQAPPQQAVWGRPGRRARGGSVVALWPGTGNPRKSTRFPPSRCGRWTMSPRKAGAAAAGRRPTGQGQARGKVDSVYDDIPGDEGASRAEGSADEASPQQRGTARTTAVCFVSSELWGWPRRGRSSRRRPRSQPDLEPEAARAQDQSRFLCPVSGPPRPGDTAGLLLQPLVPPRGSASCQRTRWGAGRDGPLGGDGFPGFPVKRLSVCLLRRSGLGAWDGACPRPPCSVGTRFSFSLRVSPRLMLPLSQRNK